MNSVSPGLTDTPAVRKYKITYDVREIVPLGRYETVDEVVDAILVMGTGGPHHRRGSHRGRRLLAKMRPLAAYSFHI